DGQLKPIYTPKNVALLMFNRVPHEYFPGALIEVTQFTRDNEVIVGSEKKFEGPLQDQIKQCMEYVFSTTNKMKSASLVTYPHKALREAIVSAVYHRGYEPENSSSTKVSIRPHCLEITSYPGPNPSLKQEEFTRGSVIPPVQARNRRIGEFLRQLNLAEARGTGVETIFRTMEKNDNPTPTFQFSNDYFRVTLPAHPKFKAAMLLKDVEEKEASGNQLEASEILQKAFDEDPAIISQHLIQKLITLLDNNCEHPNVKKYGTYIDAATKERCALLPELQKWLRNKKNARDNISLGVSLVKKVIKADADADDLLGVTAFVYELYTERTVEMRKLVLESNQAAHQLLEAYGPSLVSQHGILAFHFASIKYQIYKIKTHKKDVRYIRRNSAILKYLTDARDLLENAVTMSSGKEDPKLFAEQQRQLGYILSHLYRFGRRLIVHAMEQTSLKIPDSFSVKFEFKLRRRSYYGCAKINLPQEGWKRSSYKPYRYAGFNIPIRSVENNSVHGSTLNRESGKLDVLIGIDHATMHIGWIVFEPENLLSDQKQVMAHGELGRHLRRLNQDPLENFFGTDGKKQVLPTIVHKFSRELSTASKKNRKYFK
ncbi:Hypothetical predicted protein, partial [Paramuricea clavata]